MVHINAIKSCAKDDERGGAYRRELIAERNYSESSWAEKPRQEETSHPRLSLTLIDEEGLTLPATASSARFVIKDIKTYAIPRDSHQTSTSTNKRLWKRYME
ncbi:MAG: hypothetical protein J5732_02710 [Bacteroidaceae bacterium]|nr:hypothetical protein [Bacteroidaceae bacterium]